MVVDHLELENDSDFGFSITDEQVVKSYENGAAKAKEIQGKQRTLGYVVGSLVDGVKRAVYFANKPSQPPVNF